MHTEPNPTQPWHTDQSLDCCRHCHRFRAFDKPGLQSGAAAAARLDAHARLAVQESGQERSAYLERGLGHMASVLAGRQWWAGRGHTKTGHRQRHQSVWHLRGALWDGNWQNIAAHGLEANHLCDHNQSVLEHQVSATVKANYIREVVTLMCWLIEQIRGAGPITQTHHRVRASQFAASAVELHRYCHHSQGRSHVSHGRWVLFTYTLTTFKSVRTLTKH